jgi:hypothetical protein
MPAPAQTPTSISVNFSNVEDRREGGKAFHGPEGDYLLKVVGCVKKAKKDDENSFYLSWKLEPNTPSQYKGKGFVYHNTSLKEEALWSLRNFLEDMGIKVPKSTVKIPVAEIIKKGMIIGATLGDDEYNGKVKSQIVATFKKSEYEGTTEADEAEEDDEEEETAEVAPKKVKASSNGTAKAVAVAATTDDEDDEDLEELDVDDL